MRTPNFDALRSLFHELEFRALGNRILMEMQEESGEMRREKAEGNVGATFTVAPNPKTEGIPDLFNQDIDDVGAYYNTPPQNSIYKTFTDYEHQFIEYPTVGALRATPLQNQRLYFEWMYTQNVISGFAFSENEEQIYYHKISRGVARNAPTMVCRALVFSPKPPLLKGGGARDVVWYCNIIFDRASEGFVPLPMPTSTSLLRA